MHLPFGGLFPLLSIVKVVRENSKILALIEMFLTVKIYVCRKSEFPLNLESN